jgi:hypothetical protein
VPINPKSHADHFAVHGPEAVQKMIIDGEVTGKSLVAAREYVAAATREQTLQVARQTFGATWKGGIVGGLIGAAATIAVAWGPDFVKSVQPPVIMAAQTAKPPPK